jgi:hypothetical protein
MGSIEIQNVMSGDFSVNIGNINAAIGQTVIVPISFKNIPDAGINNCDFKVLYDSSKFDVVSVDPGDIVPDSVTNFGSNVVAPGSIVFLYNDYTQGSMPITKDGVFAYISLKTKSGISSGAYNIQVNKIGGFADTDLGNIKVVNTDIVGKVTVQ